MIQIIVPYRDRPRNLSVFLDYMDFYLQDIESRILIIEQEEGLPFNRGALINAGFQIAKPAHYFFSHDIDLLPVKCGYHPRTFSTQMIGYCSQLRFQDTQHTGFGGGVTGFLPTDFIKINGYSNEFWGWGGEDNHLREKIQKHRVHVVNEPHDFISLPHGREEPNPERFKKIQQIAHVGLKELDFSYSLIGENHYKVIL